MLWPQRSVVLVAVLSAVILSTLVAARSSYDGKLEKIPKLFLLCYLTHISKSELLIRNNFKFDFYILKGRIRVPENTIINSMVITTRIPDRM